MTFQVIAMQPRGQRAPLAAIGGTSIRSQVEAMGPQIPWPGG